MFWNLGAPSPRARSEAEARQSGAPCAAPHLDCFVAPRAPRNDKDCDGKWWWTQLHANRSPACDSLHNREKNREILRFSPSPADLARQSWRRINALRPNSLLDGTGNFAAANRESNFQIRETWKLGNTRPFSHLFESRRRRSVLTVDLQVRRTRWRTNTEPGSVMAGHLAGAS